MSINDAVDYMLLCNHADGSKKKPQSCKKKLEEKEKKGDDRLLAGYYNPTSQAKVSRRNVSQFESLKTVKWRF